MRSASSAMRSPQVDREAEAVPLELGDIAPAFTYTAFFPNDAVEGETRSSRTMRAAERWADRRG